jgi:Putative peptidase (DUF1758)
MSTIDVVVNDSTGSPHYCRAVLDSASESNYISENMVQTLKLRKSSINMIAGGQGGQTTSIRKWANIKIKSRVSDYKLSLNCLVISKITGN